MGDIHNKPSTLVGYIENISDGITSITHAIPEDAMNPFRRPFDREFQASPSALVHIPDTNMGHAEADKPIELAADAGLHLLLPRGTITFQATSREPGSHTGDHYRSLHCCGNIQD
jgi:hypothetical protein